METLCEPIRTCFSTSRRKRSSSRRRPHPNPEPFTHLQNAFMSPMDRVLHEDINMYNSKVLEPKVPGNERKVKKLKLKLGGVTRTLHTNPSLEITSSGELHENQPQASSIDYKRVANKHAFDDGFDEDDDEEIRYLKKLKAYKVTSGCGDRLEESKQKTKGIARLMGVKHNDMRDHGKDPRKKSRHKKDNDYEMQIPLDDEINSTRDEEDFVDLHSSGTELTMTTRRRALECPEFGGLIEFPNGLPNAPSKKQKLKLSVVENQLRKAETAQKRKLLADRAAKEAEAEAIRRILGQDSNRKKKEDKLKKQQEVLAQEKTDMAATLRPSTIRLSMSPKGTVLTFSEDLGLPTIFNSLACRYPPPREKCVGPNCTNEYKYRDSKSKLPLCSLHCYKAVQGNTAVLPAC